MTSVEGSLRYIETSALLLAFIDDDDEATEALRRDGHRITSTLTFTEAARTLIRESVLRRLPAARIRAITAKLNTFERRITTLAITETIQARARRAFPVEPAGTRDAIHLATLESLGQPPALITIVTRDVRIERNAKAMGYFIE